MTNSKLIRLFKNFTNDDWKNFEKFAESSYLNGGRNYTSLIKEIRKFSPEFNSSLLTKEYLYSKLFPGKAYKDTVLKTMFTGLHKLTEKFFVIDYLKTADYESARLLSYSYAARGEFEGLYNTLRIMDNNTGVKIDYDYFHQKQTIESGKVLYYQVKSDKYAKHQEHSINRGNYFIMDLILKLPQLLNDSYFSHQNYNKNSLSTITYAFAETIDFNKFLKRIDSLEFEYKDICRLFIYTALLYTRSSDTENFFNAKKLYKECFQKLSFQNQYILGLLLSNYCSQQRSPSSVIFSNELFDLYNFMLTENIFFGVYGSFIPHRPFIQFFNSACECGRIDLADNFLKQYSGKLHEKHRYQVGSMCLAKICIFKNDFHKALELLKNFNSDDIIEIIELKSLHCMIYYELFLYDNLESTIESSIKLIKTNKFIADTKVDKILMFFKLLNKISDIRRKKDSIASSVLLNKVKNGSYFTFYFWIINKLREIEKT